MATDIERLSKLMLDEFGRVHERLDNHDRRFDAIDARFDSTDARFDALENRMTSIESEIASTHRHLVALEEKVGNISGYAKEIDHLLQRVIAIEKHLGLKTNAHA